MKKQSVFGVSILIVLLFFMQTSTVFAALTLQGVQTWYWIGYTYVESVAFGDVDGDGQVEIVTGGYHGDGGSRAQLCVWDGATLALENVSTWQWASNTEISSVAVGDVDADGEVEIVTGGWYIDAHGAYAQLCVWNGATLSLENIQTWYWTSSTQIWSVAKGDVDGDGQVEIVTGGWYNDGTRHVAQLCVFSGATLALENVKTWYWTGNTYVESVAVGDVDDDGKTEIVTGGYYWDGAQDVAQLCVWSGGSLAFEDVKTWYWKENTRIYSVVVGDVDADGNVEIVTGGTYYDGTLTRAQLCVWSGATLALENIKTWYWQGNTNIYSVAKGDVDADGQMEIVTGGCHLSSGPAYRAQLCVWNGATLVLEGVTTWYWTGSTYIESVAVGDVDGDTKLEIVTGGRHYDIIRYRAQLCVWA